MEYDKLGRIAFYAGIAISLILGWKDIPYASFILVGLGIIIGLLNVSQKESHNFLLATLVLVTAGLSLSTAFGDPIKSIIHSFVAFTAAAAVVIALKEVYVIQKGK